MISVRKADLSSSHLNLGSRSRVVTVTLGGGRRDFAVIVMHSQSELVFHIEPIPNCDHVISSRYFTELIAYFRLNMLNRLYVEVGFLELDSHASLSGG